MYTPTHPAHTHTPTHPHMYKHTHIHVHTYIHANVWTCSQYMDTQTRVHTYTPLTHTYTHSSTFLHTWAHCLPVYSQRPLSLGSLAQQPWVVASGCVGGSLCPTPGGGVPLRTPCACTLCRLGPSSPPSAQMLSPTAPSSKALLPPTSQETRGMMPRFSPLEGTKVPEACGDPKDKLNPVVHMRSVLLAAPTQAEDPPACPLNPEYEPCPQDLQDVSAEHSGHGTVSFPGDVAVALACLASKHPCPTSCTSQPWPQGAALPAGSWAHHTLMAPQTATDTITITRRRGAPARASARSQCPCTPVHGQEVGLCLEPQVCGGNNNPSSP